ncbi:hypothetical protein KC367_g7 [Hortaea werneckii]|nr:hypothetical protein KC367_g7 [Hortaea werneckii]
MVGNCAHMMDGFMDHWYSGFRVEAALNSSIDRMVLQVYQIQGFSTVYVVAFLNLAYPVVAVVWTTFYSSNPRALFELSTASLFSISL